MLALVMSGAGNFGAMQVGALEVLLENGFHPQLVVGTSAGALNAEATERERSRTSASSLRFANARVSPMFGLGYTDYPLGEVDTC